MERTTHNDDKETCALQVEPLIPDLRQNTDTDLRVGAELEDVGHALLHAVGAGDGDSAYAEELESL